MAEVQVTGAEQLAALGKALRQAGDPGKGLRKELMRGIQTSAKPVRAEVRASAGAVLPHRGGLAARVARSKLRVQARTGGRNVGVRVTAASDMDIRSMDRGRLRHPLFGDRQHWYTQTVHPGWWTEATERTAPRARAEMQAAMERVARRLL